MGYSDQELANGLEALYDFSKTAIIQS